MSALEDRLRRFAYEWHEAMNSPYAVNMMPLLLEAASDVRSLAAPSLEAENAKLRELLLDVWNDAMQFDGFWDYVNDDGEIYREDELPHYQERMRKLGIEVN